jgi:RNA polymerase sigma-70 factor (ECF subfamily)
MAEARTNPEAPQGATFVTTHWSVVLSAAQVDTPAATDALDKLCRAYRYPLYAFVRRQGRDHHEAEDLTQEFFARLLEKNGLSAASPERGRFRSFLLGAMKHFLANDWRERQAQKRGGGQVILSLDGAVSEERYRLEPADPMTPEVLFERRWALTILERVKERLCAEYIAVDKAALFDELKEFLSEKQPTPHADIAARHGMNPGAVGVAIHRLRQRYGELVREEIALTVGGPEEVDEEVRHLIAALGR